MRRARIKALANIPVNRRPAKVIEKEPDGKKEEENINIEEQGRNVQLIKDVKIECNLKQIKDVLIKTTEDSKSCNENENLKSGKVNAVSVKPEREETSVSESQFSKTLKTTPVKVDKGSCQDESILPNQENSDKSQMCSSSAIELCEVSLSHNVFLQCNEMGSTTVHNLLSKTEGQFSAKNVVKKFKVGLNGELVVDESEDLQKADLSCKNEQNRKTMDNEKNIKKPIIIDDTLYSNGSAQKLTHNYINHSDGSNKLIRKETLSRKEPSNIVKTSLVKVDKGSCQDESILPYHVNRETVPHKLIPKANIPTIEQLEQHFVPPNNNRVTIHDVIHTKLYARLPKQICSVCNGVGCTTEHKILSPIDSVPEKDAVQRVKVGPNGQLVIDEGEQFSENRKFTVESSEVPTFSDMSSYRKRTMGGWNSESTSKFLKALRVFGTDFDMMKSWFPEKSRYQLYRKFKKEEKSNSAVVDDLLRNQNFDADAVQEGIEFSKKTATRNSETTNFQNQKERGKKKSKKRKIRGLVLKSIEMSSTDEETESDSTIDEMKMIPKSIANHDTLCSNNGSHQNTQNSNANRTNSLDKLRYEEMSNILKEMKSIQEERVRLKKTQRSKPD